MSSNTNIGNTPVNQGYVQLIHMGETGGIDGTLRALYDGDGTASDLLIASDKVKISTTLYIGSDTLAEYIQDTVGAMLVTNASHTNLSAAYDDAGDGAIDLTASGDVTLSNSVTLSNKTLAAPTLTGTTQGASITLSGDLTVNGTTTTVNQTNLDVSDNIIGLNRGAGSNANDSGIIIERGSTGNNAAIIWDESADKFTLGTTTSTPSATGDLTISTGTLVANLEGNVTGNVTGNADTATKIASITNSDIVQLTSSQTLTNKTLASPTFTGDVTFDDASTPQLNITDTTNTVSARVAASDTTVTFGSTTDHNVNIVRNNVGHFTLYSNYTMYNNGGNDNDFRAKDSSGNVVFKVDAGDSKTHITTLKLDSVSISAIQTGSESFADNDTSLMTSAAVQDKITSYGYTTNVGDITGVDLTSGAGITISSETNTTSGAYSSTIATNIASTSLNVSGTGQLAINLNKSALSTATLSASDFMILFDENDSENPKRFVAQDIFDSLGGITIDGTTANGVLTYGGTNNIDTESNLTFDGSNVLTATDGSESMAYTPSNNYLTIHETGATKGSHLRLATDNSDFILSAGGSANQLSLYDVNGTANRLVVNSSGLFQFLNGISVSGDATFDTDTLKVDSTNNRVGIGTTSPGTKLHISSGATDEVLRLEGTGSPYFSVYDSGTRQFFLQSAGSTVNFYAENDNTIAFFTSGTRALDIDSSQNVGIGNTSPDATLHIGDNSSSFTLGTTSGNSIDLLKLETDSTNANQLIFSSERIADGSSWTTTRERIRRRVDTSEMGYIDFGSSFSADSNMIAFGEVGVAKYMGIGGDGRVTIGTDVDTTHGLLTIHKSANEEHLTLKTNYSDNNTPRGAIKWRDASNVVGAIHTEYDGTDVSMRFGSLYNSGYNTTTRMTLTGQGQLGIGTDSPETLMHIKGADTVTGVLKIEGGKNSVTSVGEVNARLEFGSNDASVNSTGQVGASIATHTAITNGAWNDLVFSTFKQNDPGLREVMRLDYLGRLGIGTSSPGALFTVRKDGTQASSVSATYQIQTVSDSNGGMAIQAGGTSSAYLVFGDNANYDAGRIQYNNSNNQMSFWTNDTKHMSITSGGNVGIGETSPEAKLHIQEATAGTPASTFQSALKGGLILEDDSTTTANNILIKSHSLGNDEAIGGIKFVSSPDGSNYSWAGIQGLVSTYAAAGQLAFYTAANNTAGATSTERMRIDSSGHIGVGTTSPGYIFHTHDGSSDSRHKVSTSSHGTYFESGVTADSAGILLVAGHASSILNVYLQGSGGVSNEFQFQHDGDFHADGDVVAYSTTVSDKRLKDNVKTIPNALDKVMKLRGVEFDWNQGKRKGTHDLGLIAQEVEEVLPELVRDKTLCTGEYEGNEKEFKTVDYDKIVGVLIEAVKEQQEEIDLLKANYDQLKYNRR